MIKKEWIFMKKKYRQYRGNQGRSPKNMEANYKSCFWSIVFLLLVFIIVLITNCLTK